VADKLANAVTGLILAGGAGSRMGGADKGLLPYQDRPLVAHVIDRLAPQVDNLLISANRNLDAYAAFGYPVLTDSLGDYQGPLAGLAAGLAACTTPWLVTCSCDCPSLPDDLVARLLAAAEIQGASCAVASLAGRMQPTFLLCRREMLPALEAYLAAGDRKVGGWCREQGAVEVNFSDASAFDNLNTPDDLQRLGLAR
jgi:molybdopterin-guanine dinucleotide biosynthesis protein A